MIAEQVRFLYLLQPSAYMKIPDFKGKINGKEAQVF